MHFAAKPFRVCSESNSAMPSTTPAETSQCDDNGSNSDETDAKSDEGKTVMHFDSKDLILQFTKMNVTTESQQSTSQQQRHIPSPPSSSVTTKKVNKNWRFKAKPESNQRPFVLRPSKLSSLARKDRGEALFREFSVECSKELDSIVTASPHTTPSAAHSTSKRHTTTGKKKCKNGDVTLSPMTSHHHHHACQKRRKASSCAEQARQLSQDELDETIDILADFLEESVVFPKKMSYMAELMYT